MEPDGPEARAARVLRPDRPRLCDALECVLGMPRETAEAIERDGARWDESHGWIYWPRNDDAAWKRGHRPAHRWRLDSHAGTPRAAWEALASNEVVPNAWGGDESRVFATTSWHRGPLGPDFQPRPLLHPPTLRSCITLAASADAVTTAEALAREAAARLRPWLPSVSSRVEWRLGDAPLVSRNLAQDLASVISAVEAQVAPRGRAVPSDPSWRDAWIERAFHAADLAARYDEAVDRDLRVPLTVGLPRAVQNEPFASLPNPFAPLADLWLTGFGLDGFGAATTVLVAVEV